MAVSSLRDLNVLIADDEAVVRNIIRLYLESAGCRVQAVASGHEALRSFGESDNCIDLALLDVHMPGPPSPDLYEQLRQVRPSVPILFCSGASREDPLICELNRRGWPLLSKPFTRAALLEWVSTRAGDGRSD